MSLLVKKASDLLKKDKSVSPAISTLIKMLITVISILLNQKNLNSCNSSLPPSQDPNRPRKSRKDKGQKKPGGQKGHLGAYLKLVDNPNEVEEILIDRKTLPFGDYTSVGFEKRQVFDVKISRHVKEYQGEVLEDQRGVQWVVQFPEGVDNPTQYGNDLKAHSVYMSQFQLIPQLRVSNYFKDQMNLPLGKVSVQNFNQCAYKKLESFENWARQTLLTSPLNHADETGVNINGKKLWFHLLSNEKAALYQADKNRGIEAMNRMGILPLYKGIVCHDHWKSYYTYSCIHSLCNAHHLRELERAWEQDGQKWAKSMKKLLLKINQEVHKTKDNRLSQKRVNYYEQKYRKILSIGDKKCPLAISDGKKRGRVKPTKSRNLLDRLKEYEGDTCWVEGLVTQSNPRSHPACAIYALGGRYRYSSRDCHQAALHTAFIQFNSGV